MTIFGIDLGYWWIPLLLVVLYLVSLLFSFRRGSSTIVKRKKGVSSEDQSSKFDESSGIDGYFDAALAAPLSPAEPEPSPPVRIDDNVQFTVYRPKAVQPEKWYALLAFAHLSEKRPDAPVHESDPVVEVRQQAERVLGEQARQYVTVAPGDAVHSVPHHAELTFVPDIEGVEFNPPRRSFHWTESVHREEFRMKAAQDLDGMTARGRLSVFLGDILLADIAIAVKVGGPEAQQTAMESDHGRPYRKIFASYSHKDAVIVDQFERFARTMGDEYLRDWKTLRAGEVWSVRLLEMIEEADVFQLFWSRNAMESSEVRKEIEHAIRLGRPNFVRPTYWEDPLPQDPQRGLPPPELQRLHFQRVGPRALTGAVEGAMEGLPPSELPLVVGVIAENQADHPRRQLQAIPSSPGQMASRTRQVDGDSDRIGPYTLGSLAGQGAMGSIYRAVDRNTGRAVMLRLQRLLSEPSRQQFLAHVRAVERLQHPGIVQVFASGIDGDVAYVAVEAFAGISLSKWLQLSGPLEPQEAIRIFDQITAALAYAHDLRRCHGRLTPGDVIIGPNGLVKIGEFVPDAIDFASPDLLSNAIMGNPAYVAPERFRGDSGITPAADQFTVGVMLYEMLTGSRPFQASNAFEQIQATLSHAPLPPSHLNPAIPAWLDAVVMTCLAKEPADRFASMSAFGLALSRGGQGHSSAWQASPGESRETDQRRGNSGNLVAMIFLIVALLVGLLVWLF